MYFHLVCSPEVFAVGEKIDAQGFSSSGQTHCSPGPRVRKEPHISPLCLPLMSLSRGHITLSGEAGNEGVFGNIWAS